MKEPPPDHPTQRYIPVPVEDLWHGWDNNELDQIKRSAAWPLQQKIKWLEEAHELSLNIINQRRKLGLPSILSNGEIIT